MDEQPTETSYDLLGIGAMGDRVPIEWNWRARADLDPLLKRKSTGAE